MTIKRNKHLAPNHAKSCIMVLGNLKNHLWQKNKKYAPILRYFSLQILISMAAEKCRRLKQDDCKNHTY